MTLTGVKNRMSRDGVEPGGSTPEQLNALVQDKKKLWSRVIREANIRIQ